MRDHIFRPLGMRTARVNSDADIVPNRAAGYYLANDTLKNQEWVSPSINCHRRLLPQLQRARPGAVGNRAQPWEGARAVPDWRLSWTPVRLNDGGTYPYGFGWNLTQQRGYRRIGHSGAWLGFQATIQRYPDFDITVIVLANLAQAKPESIAVGIAGLLEPVLTPPHLLATRLPGATPPTPIDKLLGDIASGRDSAEVTPEFRASFPGPRRELIAGLLKVIQTWTLLGCESVRGRGISRLRSRIEHICYAKGTAGEGSLLFTVLYGSGWRAAGLDNVFGI